MKDAAPQRVTASGDVQELGVPEVIRGGLQAISRGQYEAAESMGLGYWQATPKEKISRPVTVGEAAE